MNYAVATFKSIGENQLERLFSKVVRVKVTNDVKGISGRLTSISDRFIELTHLDGRTTLIKIDEIVFISPIKGKESV